MIPRLPLAAVAPLPSYGAQPHKQPQFRIEPKPHPRVAQHPPLEVSVDCSSRCPVGEKAHLEALEEFEEQPLQRIESPKESVLPEKLQRDPRVPLHERRSVAVSRPPVWSVWSLLLPPCQLPPRSLRVVLRPAALLRQQPRVVTPCVG